MRCKRLYNFFTNLLQTLDNRLAFPRQSDSMKKIFAGFVLASGMAGLLLARHALASSSENEGGHYIVHEWGTFTDVQGGDGQLLSWRPLQTSELPGFVRNWQNPGMNRRFAGFFAGGEPFRGKRSMVTWQRLETPVMYFYSAERMSVNVGVDFPGGVITEWYPQATQIGPSVPLDSDAPGAATVRASRAVWTDLLLLPESKGNGRLQNLLPPDQPGAHYFAARKTGADTVRMELGDGTKEADNYEKFIFYRGAGSFRTPLRVSVNGQNEIVVEDTGSQALSHLFLLAIKDGRGGFEEIEHLQPGESKTFPAIELQNCGASWFYSIADGQAKLGTAVRAALTSEGLFEDEAAAMVNTWKDSWFAEDGVRVFYLLPRAWTDKTLPLTLNPKPERVVRVMVGRAEVIMPETAKELAAVLAKAEAGDQAAREQGIDDLQKLNRFAEPALQLADRGEKSQDRINFGYQLLSEIAQRQSKGAGN